MGDTDLQIRHDVKISGVSAEKKLFSESVMPELLTTNVYVEQRHRNRKSIGIIVSDEHFGQGNGKLSYTRDVFKL